MAPDNDNCGTIASPGSPRPDLKPVDPRGTASPTNEFDIVGVIDSNNVFHVGEGESSSMNF